MPDTKTKPAKKQPAAGKPPLRFEWIQAGSLSGNPRNWRKHPEGQLSALKDVLGDPEVGWAGALLFNERTGRLIDGHGRLKTVGPEDPVPVLIGNWSEDAEKKILLTLDPLASMAEADPEALKSLLADVSLDSDGLKALGDGLEKMLADLTPADTSSNAGSTHAGPAGGSGAGGVGLGTPTVQYTIIFDEDQQQKRWFNFLRYLKKRYPDPETLAARLDLFLETIDLT